MEEVTLTFSEVRDTWIAGFRDNDYSRFSIPANGSVFRDQVSRYSYRSHFYGSTGEEMQEYLREGFTIPALDDIASEVKPVRKRARPRYNDCEGDFRYDLFMTGDENHYVQWSNRESIPGISVEFETGFSGFVNSGVIAEYMSWICSALIAIEASGVDAAVYVANEGERTTNRKVIRYRMEVKREGERNDFQSWSALFSPGAYRMLGWIGIILACDRSGNIVSSNMGTPHSKGWNVSYDRERRTVVIGHDSRGSNFPSESMTEQLQSALESAKQS